MNGGGTLLDERTLGKKLQQARQQAGLTQQSLCGKANLSYSTLAKIERGAIKAPSIFTIQAIAVALNVSLDDLMGYSTKSSFKSSKGGVEFIYFDVNGCLVKYFEKAFITIAQDYGVSSDIVESAFWRYNDIGCMGKISLDEFNKLLAKAIGANSLNWLDYYLSAVEVIKPMQDLLEWTANNYRFGILSNSISGALKALFDRGMLPSLPFSAIIDSSEVGMIKPSSSIFELATQKAQIQSGKILLIDDTKANLVSADKNGWRVMWFDYARPQDCVDNIKKALEPIN